MHLVPRMLLFAGPVLATATLFTGVPPARAGDDLVRMQANSANVIMPTITYDNQRYSKLNQVTTRNVGRLEVAWTFSTGRCCAGTRVRPW